MPRPRRAPLQAEAARINRDQLARLGAELRASRGRRRLTQVALGRRVGLAQSTVSRAERGLGGPLSLDTWQRLFTAVGRRLVVEAARDPQAEPTDAGHLKVQELVLRLGRVAGFKGTFELATRPTDPSRSADVGMRSDRHRVLVLVECWNTIGDVGAAARSTTRKLTEAEALAIAIGGDAPYRVRSVWVVRDTRRNRELLASFPEVFASRFPGSSSAWVRALAEGAPPPADPGLVRCDVAATRLFAWRRRVG